MPALFRMALSPGFTSVHASSYPGLFIKNVDIYVTFFYLVFYIDSYSYLIYHFVHNIISICNQYFLLYEQDDLTADTENLENCKWEKP